MNWVIDVFLGCQFFVVLFIAVHDWIPLGKLNNLAGIRAVDSTRRLLVVTVLSTLPFAIGLAASVYYAATGFPMWLMWWLWISYGLGLYGMLRAWWVPYLLVADPVRAARYQERFAHTHAFLPLRNGIRPDTLHVCFHAVFLVLLILLGVLTFSGHAFASGAALGHALRR
jgi:hypothetical protein